MRIPPQTEAPGSKARGVIYTHGKITPMFRMLYANAEYGDITRTSPEARLVKTWTGAVAVSPPRRNTSTSPTLPSLEASRSLALGSPSFSSPGSAAWPVSFVRAHFHGRAL